MAEEKEIVTELIQLYRDLPCLWDLNSEQYKDNNKKRLAWEVLVSKWKTIDPNANDASVKKKIDNLKASYKRELKKVKDSKKRTGSAANEVHKPNLWYFDLMAFLDYKKDAQRSGIDTLTSDECDDESQGIRVGKKRRQSLLERNKHKLKETAQDLLRQNKTKTNSFAVYVGEQLDSLSTNQRHIAEKLISEVLFLGKTKNLNFDSKIKSDNNRHCSTFHSHGSSRLPSPQYITPSLEYTSSSPPYIRPSPQYNIHSPEYNTSAPQHNTPPQHTPSPQHSTPSSEPKCITLTPKYASLTTFTTKFSPPSSSPIQDQPTLQSIQSSSLSQHETQQKDIESPSSPQYQSLPIQLKSSYQIQTTETPIIVQPTEEISQNLKDGAGMLLKELLTFKGQQK